jgi:pyrimidine-nucleoside phosphorylase
MEFQEVIAHRRDGVGNSQEELEMVAHAAADVARSVPNAPVRDYHLSAWLMAAYLRPLGPEETAWLTVAMADSGERLDLTGLPKPWTDKHSTGGVGDKTSIILLPLLASCGMTIVKMSGRGLGITGGTVDKLESVPGFRMDLTPPELKAQAAKIGLAVTGQTANLVPADKALYALRDVTATVDSVPLIVSSILSKKLAGGAERVILDVKCGSGGFMDDLGKATVLARSLIETGERIGLPVFVSITDMSQPLGRCVGNLLEVKEAAEVLKGAPGRLTELCVRLAGHALVASGLSASEDDGFVRARHALNSGQALGRAEEWFAAQGSTVDVFGHPEKLPVAPVSLLVASPFGPGFVEKVDARVVGQVVLGLGGGREKTSDTIDPTVGVECLKAVGDEVGADEDLFVVHAASDAAAEEAAKHLVEAVKVAKKPAEPIPLVFKTLP